MSAKNGGSELQKPSVANAMRLRRINEMRALLDAAHDALTTEDMPAPSEQGPTWAALREPWAEELVDALWAAANPRPEALAVMDALKQAKEPTAVLLLLEGAGHLRIVEQLRGRTNEIARAWKAFQNTAPGYGKGGNRTSKFEEVQCLLRHAGIEAKATALKAAWFGRLK